MKNNETKIPNSIIAYVCIPADVDREQFINRCYSTNTLFLRSERGDLFKEVFASDDILKCVSFPLKHGIPSTPILLINIPFHNKPIAIAALNQKNTISKYRKPNVFREFVKTLKSYINFNGDANTGVLDINIVGLENGFGKLNIFLSNPDSSSEFNVFVKGDINIKTEGKFNLRTNDSFNIDLIDENDASKAKLQYILGEGFIIEDEFQNKIITRQEKIVVKSGKEQGKEIVVDELVKIAGETNFALLGNKTQAELLKDQAFLQALKTVLSGPPIPEAGNGSPSSLQQVLSAALSALSLGSYNEVLSNKVKID